MPGGPCWPLEKGEDGRWRGTLELEGGFRYVDILMDGETVLLPQLPIGFGYSRTVNFLDVPAEETEITVAGCASRSVAAPTITPL